MDAGLWDWQFRDANGEAGICWTWGPRHLVTAVWLLRLITLVHNEIYKENVHKKSIRTYLFG